MLAKWATFGQTSGLEINSLSLSCPFSLMSRRQYLSPVSENEQNNHLREMMNWVNKNLLKSSWRVFLVLMQNCIHVDISTSTWPICTKITGYTYQPISNHSCKFELNWITGSVEFDVDLDVVSLNNNSLFGLTWVIRQFSIVRQRRHVRTWSSVG